MTEMQILTIGLAGAAMLLLGVAMSWILGWANKTFHVEVDPRVAQAIDILPGANCGGCGFVGCAEYAEAVVAGEAPPDKCPVGGQACAAALAKLLSIELKESYPYRPVVHCGASYDQRLKRSEYRGEMTCTSANLIADVQGCAYGCLGLGDCQTACPFDAIHMNNGLAEVDYEKCTGCGKCAEACPRNIIHMVPFKAEKMLVIKCSNRDFGKDVKAVCKVGCLGCKACSKLSEMVHMEGNLPKIDYDKYDPQHTAAFEGLLTKCPMKNFVYVGKPSEKDLAAVADKELPELIRDEFKTTVDKTNWHG